MALWCSTAPGIDADRWVHAGRDRGVVFEAGSSFAFDRRPVPAVRLGFACLAERELREAVRRLAAALPEARGGRRR
jgi:GntR family transcriptional regulator/MocR family aminotransferase